MPIDLAAREGWLVTLLADATLSAKAKIVGVRIGQYLNLKTGRCNPALPTLAAAVALSLSGTRRAVAELERAGWIAVDRSKGRATHNYGLTSPTRLAHSNSVSADTVEHANSVKTGDFDASTVSELWHPNIQENITPLTPHGGAVARSQGHSGRHAVPKSDPRWPLFVEAMRRRQPAWRAPDHLIDIGNGPEPGWYFAPDLINPRRELALVSSRAPPG